MVGYTAVTGQLDAAALLLFLVLVVWQMPHFYSIAIYRLKDYSAAKIPVLPIERGMSTAKIFILTYIVAFGLVTSSLSLFGFTGKIFAAITILVATVWFIYGLKNFKTQEDQIWGRNMFFISLIALTVFCVTVSVDSVLALK